MTEALTKSSGARAALDHRLDELRAAPGYRNYLAVREQVLAMKDRARAAAGPDVPSSYWQEELANIEYMLDASPLVIEKLRHHCFAITGIRPYEYRPTRVTSRKLFEDKLQRLIELEGRDLLVPESPALGGFGWQIDGSLYNIDTLKFFEVLIGFERSGLLGELQASADPVVCEIGPGWGGFAYQLKTLVPHATLVLVDFPELFLFGATYLLTVFPDARVGFWGEDGVPEALAAHELDFVVVPHTEIEQLDARLDLVVNMVSFQEMTSEQVRSYVHWAATSGAPYLYSLNRDRSPHNEELTSVREIMAEAYDLTQIDLLPVAYSNFTKPVPVKPPKPPKPPKQELPELPPRPPKPPKVHKEPKPPKVHKTSNPPSADV